MFSVTRNKWLRWMRVVKGVTNMQRSLLTQLFTVAGKQGYGCTFRVSQLRRVEGTSTIGNGWMPRGNAYVCTLKASLLA